MKMVQEVLPGPGVELRSRLNDRTLRNLTVPECKSVLKSLSEKLNPIFSLVLLLFVTTEEGKGKILISFLYFLYSESSPHQTKVLSIYLSYRVSLYPFKQFPFHGKTRQDFVTFLKPFCTIPRHSLEVSATEGGK